MNQIDFTKRSSVYEAAIENFGTTAQMVVALEELSECQKEICKILRGKGNLENLAEEVADATIMLEQLRQMFPINEQVCRKMDEKIARLVYRLNTMESEGDL